MQKTLDERLAVGLNISFASTVLEDLFDDFLDYLELFLDT